MQLETVTHVRGVWSAPFPDLDSERTLVLCFGSSSFLAESDALHELRGAYPRSVVLGCSSAGEILGDRLQDDSLVVAVARFERTPLRRGWVEMGESQGSLDAGRALAQQLSEPDLHAVFVVSEGLSVNGTELVRGMTEVLGDSVVLTGGLAGDGPRFEQTWVIGQDGPRPNGVAAVGLYGDAVRVGHGSKGGWDIFGPERTVTRSEGNVLYELDGQPALQLYKTYLGERAEGLPATALLFPLAIRTQDSDTQLVRTVLSVDEQAMSMTFAGDVPQGCRAQLMRANFDRLVDGAHAAASLAEPVGADPTDPVLAVAISCVGRRLVLGQRTEDEIEATLEVLPQGTQQVGFYSYGEICPAGVGSCCDLHNQTMTLTTIRETA
ncbi:MAG: FIST C-terminal domain-containing protein [Myxococcales bacterium]|nr:FIST C-terminal domain-containing protein [Myxococcales bacterium]